MISLSALAWLRLQCARAAWGLCQGVCREQHRACPGHSCEHQMRRGGRSSPSQIISSFDHPFVMMRNRDRYEGCFLRVTTLWICFRYPQMLASCLTVQSKLPSNVQLSKAQHPLVFSLSTFQLKDESLGVFKREVEITKLA